MFGYSDYFNEEKQDLGYAAGGEELFEHLALLDMLLEHFLDAKTGHSEGLVFSRGMRMTEAETEAYFFKAPAERKSIGFDAEFASDIRNQMHDFGIAFHIHEVSDFYRTVFADTAEVISA